jgi:hypothetical protein
VVIDGELLFNACSIVIHQNTWAASKKEQTMLAGSVSFASGVQVPGGNDTSHSPRVWRSWLLPKTSDTPLIHRALYFPLIVVSVR